MKRSIISSIMICCLLALTAACSDTGIGGEGDRSVSRENQGSGFFGPDLEVLPEGSLVSVSLQNDVVSSSATVGQPVTGQVTADVQVNGNVLIPAGSRVNGSLTAVKPAKRFGGQAMVAVGFDSITLPGGETVPVEGGMAAYAKKQAGKDAGAIIGGTVGGAILGKIVGDDSKDAIAGAVIGGGIGTAIASRKGDEAYLPSGTTARLQTTTRVEVPVV